jgi:hypothetical protein
MRRCHRPQTGRQQSDLEGRRRPAMQDWLAGLDLARPEAETAAPAAGGQPQGRAGSLTLARNPGGASCCPPVALAGDGGTLF